VLRPSGDDLAEHSLLRLEELIERWKACGAKITAARARAARSGSRTGTRRRVEKRGKKSPQVIEGEEKVRSPESFFPPAPRGMNPSPQHRPETAEEE